jgi:hypothetical protein
VKYLRTIKPVAYVLGLGGVSLFVILLIREGAGQVGSAISRAGWGLLGVTLYHCLQTLSDAAVWGIPLKIGTAVMLVDLTVGVVTKVIYIHGCRCFANRKDWSR